jgi:DNA segregation ATPase FtsK/SpoIIIE-like protein
MEDAYSSLLTKISTKKSESIINKEDPEEILYDYAMNDIPTTVLSDIPPEPAPERKNKKLVSLRDVLVERGNFWQDKSKEVKNIWERDPNMPEEMMMINDNTLVGDVLFSDAEKEEVETEPTISPEILPEEMPAQIHSNEAASLLGMSQDGEAIITIEQESLRRHTLIVGQTGSGKSTLMERMILQDIDAGR